MNLGSIMIRSVVRVRCSQTLQDVCRVMREAGSGYALVLDQNDPVGIITEQDIVRAVSLRSRNVYAMKADELMRRQIITRSPRTEIKKTLHLMIQKGIRRIPVVDRGKLAGMVTYDDIMRQIQKELAESHIRTRKLEHEAVKDDLTDALRLRYFSSRLLNEIKRIKKYGGEISLIMIDVDRFKKINDEHGHAAGDHVLKQCVHVIRENMRKVNILGRLGGDEFGILAPISGLRIVSRLAKRIQQKIRETEFHYNGRIIPVTLSMGVASWDYQMNEPADLMARADQALYKAKREGRNRVAVKKER